MRTLRPRVITAADARAAARRGPGAPQEDSYLAKLVAYIPAESIATYQAVVNIIPQESQAKAAPWVGVVILALTPVWMFFATKTEEEGPQWFQTIVSPFAFIVWLVALNSPFVVYFTGITLEHWHCSIALIAATAAIPLLEKVFVK
jgi:FtsH-binding integral membrane protein